MSRMKGREAPLTVGPHPEQGVSRVAANQIIKQEQTLFATGFFTLMYFFLGRNMIEKNYSSVSSPNP